MTRTECMTRLRTLGFLGHDKGDTLASPRKPLAALFRADKVLWFAGGRVLFVDTYEDAIARARTM